MMRTSTLLIIAAVTFSFADSAAAQRRPGVGMGFYTTTGLLSADLDLGTVTTTTGLAEAPRVTVSGLFVAPVRKTNKRAWVVGLRGTALSLGNRGACYVTPQTQGCQDSRFEERAAALTGGAFDIRATMLRVMVGTTWYDVERQGARLGATVRVDFTTPRQRGGSPTLFFTRTFLGSERGEGVAMITLGAGFRWIQRK